MLYATPLELHFSSKNQSITGAGVADRGGRVARGEPGSREPGGQFNRNLVLW